MPERNLVFLACSIACLTMLIHTGCSKIPASGWHGFRNNLGQQPPPLPERDMRREAALLRDRSLAEQAQLASQTIQSPPPAGVASSHSGCDHPGCNHSSSKPKLPFAEPIEFPITKAEQTADVESLETNPRSVESPVIFSIPATSRLPNSSSNQKSNQPLIQPAIAPTTPVVVMTPKTNQNPATRPSTKIATPIDVRPVSEFQTVSDSNPALAGSNKSSQLMNRSKIQSAPPSSPGTNQASTIQVDPTAFDSTSQTARVLETQPSPKPILKASTQSSVQASGTTVPRFSSEHFFQPVTSPAVNSATPDNTKLESSPSSVKPASKNISAPARSLENQFVPPKNISADQNFVPLPKVPVVNELHQPLANSTIIFRPIPPANASPSTAAQPKTDSIQTAIGSAAVAQASHFEELVLTSDQQEIESTALRVVNPQFCREIRGFGQIKTFPSTKFESSQRMLIYCEVENHLSPVLPTSAGDRHVTRLAGSYSILAANGKSVQAGAFPNITDESVRQRRDFYCYFPVTLANLSAGEYRFELKLQDLADGREAGIKPAMKFSVR